MPNNERRLSRRAPFVAAVRAGVSGGGAARVELALARNLGEDGMELRGAGSSGWAGAELSLAFELPDGGRLLEVRGQVVFERADGRWRQAGVRFEGMPAADRARIARYLDAQRA